MFQKKKIFIIFICMTALLAVACGKKGDLTLRAFEKPATAANIKAMHRDNEINIFWQYPASERSKIKGCQFLRSDSKDSNYRELAFFKKDDLQYVDKDFTLGREYYYKIRCLSLKDVYSDDSPILKITPLPLLQKPEGVSFIITNDTIKIQWQHIADAQYNIYKSYQKGSYSVLPINSVPLKEIFFNDKIETGKTVYYTIRSHRGTEIRDESSPSKELEINPSHFVPKNPSDLMFIPLEKKVYLLWKENPEIWIKGYRVYRKRLPEEKFNLIGETITPVFTDSEIVNSKTTYYYITAIGPELESQPSAVIAVKKGQEN